LQNLTLAKRQDARDVSRADELGRLTLQLPAFWTRTPRIHLGTQPGDGLHHRLAASADAAGCSLVWLSVRHLSASGW
jgi:hypothetical protein